jgi:hypothetical protein
VFLLLAMLFPKTTVNAVIVYSSGETIEKVLDLPRTNEFKMRANGGRWNYAKVGILHKQFSVFWIPLINYGDEKYVLYIDHNVGDYDYAYYELPKEDIEYLHEEFGIPLQPKLPFWDAWGGKLIFLTLFVLIGIIAAREKKKKDNTEMLDNDGV